MNVLIYLNIFSLLIGLSFERIFPIAKGLGSGAKQPRKFAPSPKNNSINQTRNAIRDQITSHRNRRLLPSDCGVNLLDDRILGGTTTQLNEFPWLALLLTTDRRGDIVGIDCGGSLINSRYVLTAAHCIPDVSESQRVRTDLTKVRLGEFDTSKDRDCQNKVCSDEPIDVTIEEIIMHPLWKPRSKTFYNDIALLRLKSRVPMSTYVSPICLPLDGIQEKNYTGQKLAVAGWGRTSNSDANFGSKTKRKVMVSFLSLQTCQEMYERRGRKIRNTQLCAGGEKNKDSCHGDSGGPLMSSDIVKGQVRWHVQGIVSFGPPQCGTENVATVYTRVSRYVNWILDTIRD